MTVKLYDKANYNNKITLALDIELTEATGTTVKDISRFHNHGTFPGGANNPTWVQLANGTWVLSFNNNHWVNFGEPASLEPTTALTIWQWFYPTQTVATSRLLNRFNAVASYTAYGMYHTTNVGVQMYTGGVLRETELFIHGGVTINTWVFAAATYDGSKIITYVKVGSGPLQVSAPFIASGVLSYLGVENVRFGRFSSATQNFTGYLGGCGLLGIAWTEREIRDKILATQGRFGL